MKLKRKTPTCLAPFLSFYVNSFRIGVCCEYSEVNGLPDKSCKDSWNSEEFIHYRKTHYAGIFEDLPEVCKTCIKSPTSYSQHFFRSYMDEFYDIMENYDRDTGYMSYDSIREFTIGTSNKCNLACVTCGPEHSHTRARLYGELSKSIIATDKKNIIEENYQALDFLDMVAPKLKILFFHGGEPTMSEKTYDIINIIKKHNKDIWVYYLSNGTVSKFPNGKDVAEELRDLTKVLMTVSIDAMGEALNYIRYPCNENKIISFLQKMKKDLPKCVVNIHMTVSNLSLLNMIDTLNRLMEITENDDVKIDMFSVGLVSRPDFYSPNVLPITIKEKIVKNITEFIKDKNMKGWPYWLKVDALTSILRDIDTTYFDEKLWGTFLSYQTGLDSKRNLNLFEVFPMLTSYQQNSQNDAL